MSTNFGFLPVKSGRRYFVSYKTEDNERVGAVARRLNEAGVPLWYDYGIEKGMFWEMEIANALRGCEAVILFATKRLFAAEDTFVRKEFWLAQQYQKPIYVVWMDDIAFRDVNQTLIFWFHDVKSLQGIETAGCSVDKITWSILHEFPLVSGLPSQPAIPIYEEQKEEPVSQEKASQKPEPEPAPIPAPAVKPASSSAPKAYPEQKPAPVQKRQVKAGDIIPFGQYPQGAGGEVKPLEWRVLDVRDGRALLITDKLIDAIPYNEAYVPITWETCTLRQWMNGDFISRAFSRAEQEQIATVTNQNPNNPTYGTTGGKPTQDKIFLLSIGEADRYFRSDEDRMAAVTAYAKKRGSYVSDKYSLATGEETGWWWLRSPGRFGNYAAYVFIIGDIRRNGNLVYDNLIAVRPAFWLNL